MFIGAIDKPSRMICERILDSLDKGRRIFVGCSGNFTFDRVAAAKGFRVFSNDVSLYSRVIAGIVMGDRFPFACRNEELSRVFGENGWGDDAQSDLVKIMFASRFGQFADRKNDFQRTMLENYVTGARRFYEGTMERFSRLDLFGFHIEDFYYGDFKRHLERATDKDVVFLYAPTYKGGYEKLYKFIDESFEYEKAEYDMFDSKEAGPYYAGLLEEKEACIYSDILFPETEKWLTGEVSYSGGKRTVYLYSSVDESKRKYYLTDTPKDVGRTPRILQPDKTLPENPVIAVAPCKVALVNHFKHLFMSARVDYSTGGDFALAFLMDGEVFGFASFASGLGTSRQGELLFLHSDFVVPSCIDRLSKLLLYILRSKDVYRLVMRFYIHSYKGLQTSVYTPKPVSMKYRGIFSKLEPEKPEPGKLTYTAEFTGFSIQECFERWQRRQPLQ